MTTVAHRPAAATSPYWRIAAACSGHDGDLWFPVSFQTAAGRDQVEDAKRICHSCLVQLACLEDALQREGTMKAESRDGIYGGLTPSERFNVYRARYRAGRGAA